MKTFEKKDNYGHLVLKSWVKPGWLTDVHRINKQTKLINKPTAKPTKMFPYNQQPCYQYSYAAHKGNVLNVNDSNKCAMMMTMPPNPYFVSYFPSSSSSSSSTGRPASNRMNLQSPVMADMDMSMNMGMNMNNSLNMNMGMGMNTLPMAQPQPMG